MKFLCDQCKAKYQIADEKVQGKTLRMKCRKCGHVIEIRAADGGGGATGDTMQVDSLTAEQAAEALNKAKAQPVRPPAKPTPAPPAAKGAPPRPGAVSGPTPKPGAAAPRPGAPGAPRPGAPRASEAGKDSGALASAFSKNLTAQKKPEPAPSSASHHADTPPEEWYAAIDEVPVGPIRLTDLRQKYAQGAVTDDSLVWREGFEEWRPLRTLPDLFQLVREEVSGAFQPPGARNSLLPAAPGQPPKRSTSGPSATARASTRPQVTPAPAPVAARGNVIPFSPARSGAAAARKLEEEQFDDEATQIALAPVILPQPTAAAAAKVESDPFAKPAAMAPTATPPPSHTSIDPIGGLDVPERLTMLNRISVKARGISKGSVALIAAGCLLLGVVIAVMMVKPKIIERVVEKRVEVPVSVNVPVPTGPVATASAEASASQKVASKGGPGPAAKGAPTTTATTGGGSNALKGLDMGPAGPGLGGPDPGGPPTPGLSGALPGKDVESVVTAKRIGVRKQCYEQNADKGDASVTITLTINPSGAVDSADITNSSGPAAPLVGPCIQKMARGWRFPASGSGGTFAIPFIFKAG
ncbi:MAG: GYF domain-containing protein [Polyangiales bacterium]